MDTEDQDYSTLANFTLIAQVATYYRSTMCDLESYQEMNLPTLEELSTKHLMHWKRELHELIFNGMNCADERLAS